MLISSPIIQKVYQVLKYQGNKDLFKERVQKCKKEEESHGCHLE